MSCDLPDGAAYWLALDYDMPSDRLPGEVDAPWEDDDELGREDAVYGDPWEGRNCTQSHAIATQSNAEQTSSDHGRATGAAAITPSASNRGGSRSLALDLDVDALVGSAGATR